MVAVLLGLTLTFEHSAFHVAAQTQNMETVPNQYIVIYKDDADPNLIQALLNTITTTLGITILQQFTDVFKGTAIKKGGGLGGLLGQLTNIVQFLLASPLVDAVIPDTILHTPYTPHQALALYDSVGSGVRRVTGGGNYTVGTAGVPVAIIDGGFDFGHPDLPSAMQGVNCIRPGQSAQDDNGHGTHVAGILGAANDGSGLVGIAPSTPMYAVKVSDQNGNALNSNVICGLEWVSKNAAQTGIKVISFSMGQPGSDDGNCGRVNKDPIHRAICRLTQQGITVVASAGNSGTDLATNTPGAYSEVLAVTALSDYDGREGGLSVNVNAGPACTFPDADDTGASYSNYVVSSPGNRFMAAPGTCIISTYLRTKSAYQQLSGTSMSVPHVSGYLARCFLPGAPCYGMTPAQAIAKLIELGQTKALLDPIYANNVQSRYGTLLWAGV
jgi:subtilisin family serine protease